MTYFFVTVVFNCFFFYVDEIKAKCIYYLKGGIIAYLFRAFCIQSISTLYAYLLTWLYIAILYFHNVMVFFVTLR